MLSAIEHRKADRYPLSGLIEYGFATLECSQVRCRNLTPEGVGCLITGTLGCGKQKTWERIRLIFVLKLGCFWQREFSTRLRGNQLKV